MGQSLPAELLSSDKQLYRYKIARVDQKETALGKEMREKGTKAGKEEKIIRRELGCILTAGTLVDESMLQDEMATYCVSIKVSHYGIVGSVA